MNRKLLIGAITHEYQLVKSRRARRLRLSVGASGNIRLTVPQRTPLQLAEDFLRSKLSWLTAAIRDVAERKRHKPAWVVLPYHRSKARARQFLTRRVREINRHYGFRYRRISVKNHSSRWGSCSKEGNLNFNYRLLFLSQLLADYVVVHELCHLAELNHSKNFWALVAQCVPDYVERRREIREYPL